MSGSTSFEWNGNAAVEKVQLAGSFTQWKPVEMEKNSEADEKWALKLDLSPGEYEFKFVVDGKWQHSELLPTKTNDEGITNNVIIVEGNFCNIYLFHIPYAWHYKPWLYCIFFSPFLTAVYSSDANYVLNKEIIQ